MAPGPPIRHNGQLWGAAPSTAEVVRVHRRTGVEGARMRDIAELLPIAVVAVAVIIVLAQLLTGSSAYEQIGRGGLSVEDETPAGLGVNDERDDEIRQMLAARNARRARQGRPQLDIEAELGRLTASGRADAPPAASRATGAGAPDPGLEQEVRDLVIARNARRARRGQDPLDVELEVQRQLREL